MALLNYSHGGGGNSPHREHSNPSILPSLTSLLLLALSLSHCFPLHHCRVIPLLVIISPLLHVVSSPPASLHHLTPPPLHHLTPPPCHFPPPQFFSSSSALLLSINSPPGFNSLLLGTRRRWVHLSVMYCPCHCRCHRCHLSSVAAKCWVVLILSDGSMEEGWEKMGHDKCCGPFLQHTTWASDFMGSPLLSFLPNSSITQE